MRYKTKIGIWMLSFPLLIASCSTYSAIQPPASPVTLTPGTTADCSAACVNLRRLHCKSGDPTPQAGTCEAVCQNTESSGYASENPQCLAKVKSCGAEEDACANPGQ